jgi:hypothetical protein
MRTATTFIAQVLEIASRWWRIITTAHPVGRSPLPAQICSRPDPSMATPPRMFQREYALLPGLARSVAAADTERVKAD